MQLRNELPSIVFWHTHKSTSHDNEFNLSKERQSPKEKKGDGDVPYPRYDQDSSTVPLVLSFAHTGHIVLE